ncbi:MAG TPA: hypothetical protein P5105_00585 [Victivallales bacterium]|nr:hypothetical protein [Victivallales bacterium]HRR05753.1 hypothetical protein [Victivallales bacterium]
MKQKYLKNFTLEISLKPFLKKNDKFIGNIFYKIFMDWFPILQYSENISVLFWVGDGTEILEFDGNMQKNFEWGKWLGFAYDGYPTSKKEDPKQEAIVGKAREFRKNPSNFNYQDLKNIILIMKKIGREIYDIVPRAGIAFDPGPEFVKSKFKYELHTEILLFDKHNTGGCGRNIDCTSKLKADTKKYAGFPEGIPEGTSFGRFLGRQTKFFTKATGIDYIWFSNSFGFGRCPYGFGAFGEFFDGKKYLPENNEKCRDAVIQFWQDFRKECKVPIETRGTDFPLGMDLVNHATPYKQLYEGNFNFISPPNTPWPALTNNYGIALAGYMSRIAAFPGHFPYRFYASDPWWCNSPWFDQFERSPHDIYMSLSVSRIDRNRIINTPNRISILTVDTSWGEIPEEFPNEIIPHLKRALKEKPDIPSPLIWIYPFEQYNKLTFLEKTRIQEVYAGDILIQEAINCGLPLNTVVSDKNFTFNYRDKNLYGKRILLSPVPDSSSKLEKALLWNLERGTSVLLYGSTLHSSKTLQDLLGITHDLPLEGEFRIKNTFEIDNFLEANVSDKYLHQSIISAGGISEVIINSKNLLFKSEIFQGQNKRICALSKKLQSRAILGWVRGSSSADMRVKLGRTLPTWPSYELFKSENLFRHVLSTMGYSISFIRKFPDNKSTHTLISRNSNAFLFTLFSSDQSCKTKIKFPWGAPILNGMENEVVNGYSIIPFNLFRRLECRIFLISPDNITLSLHRVAPKHFRYKNRLLLKNLRNSSLRFYPPSGQEKTTQILLNPNEHHWTVGEKMDIKFKSDETGNYYIIKNVTGSMTFAWY